MLREYDQALRYVNMLADYCLAVVALYFAIVIRDQVFGVYIMPGLLRGSVQFYDMILYFLVLPLSVVLLMRAYGQYDSLRTGNAVDSIGKAAVCVLIASALGMIIGFITDARTVERTDVSRLVLVVFALCCWTLLTLKQVALRHGLGGLRAAGYNYRTLALVGDAKDIEAFGNRIAASPYWGFRIVAAYVMDRSFVALPPQVLLSSEQEALYIAATKQDLIQYLRTAPVDEVIHLSHHYPLSEFGDLYEACEEMGLRTRLAVSFFRNTITRPRLDVFENIPLVTWHPGPDSPGALLAKQCFDRVASAVLICLLFPVFVAVAVLVKVTSSSWSDPIFYGQTRCGLNGRLFTMWKFRTMIVNAEAHLEKLRQQNEMAGPAFKIKHDPRITPVGRWLRRLSIDELPQLYNVLIGDMSLVGPRPPIPSEVAQYDRWQRRRLSMKPGITCLWQVSGRNNLSFDTWMKLDLEYIDNWSLWLDVKILFRTIYAVTTGHGAM